MHEEIQGLVKATSVLKNQEDILMTDKENAAKIERNIEELKQSEEEKARAVKIAKDGAVDLKRSSQELSKSLEEHEKEYQIEVGRTETELKQLQTRISHCEKDLKEKSSQLLSKREEAVAVENELNVRRKDVEKVQKALESLAYEEGRMETLQKDHASEVEMVQRFKDEVRILSSQLANVDFSYNDPAKNFDRSRVKGVVAKLIKVKDRSAMTALEVAAGGKLDNIVVDTENTGKQLLQNGGLRRRVTIIPLKKIQSHPVPQRVQTAAVRLVSKGNAEVALSLVGYDEELQQIINRQDYCSRHYSRGGGELLRQLHALAEAELKLSFHQKHLSDIDAKINELLPLQRMFKDLKAQLELKSYDLSLFQKRAEQNEHHKFVLLLLTSYIHELKTSNSL
ncbi:Structural maintenance of chromosomes protein 2-1 [Abeliophyllum distichum]|uniref:Structural maintenance of chromosomes protein 2-1 n=1 Tax=Abeliophyllum distichum TaxID=126358 RepID=A0ABD1VRP5_9LAMI